MRSSRLSFALCLFPLAALSAAVPDETAEDASNAQGTLQHIEQQLYPLLLEKNKIAAEYGLGHPTNRVLDRRIEIHKKKLARIQSDGDPEVSKSLMKTLDEVLRLILERDRAIRIYGQRHPKVAEISKEIERLLRSNRSGPSVDMQRQGNPRSESSGASERLDESGLRAMVHQLLRRVDKLEGEVEKLKER